MSVKDEPKPAGPPEDPELEATDGGWDPYVTSLLMGSAQAGESTDVEDDEQPVMSLSRERRGR
jgi:hypothetical protein